MVGLSLTQLKKRNNFQVLRNKLASHGIFPIVDNKKRLYENKDFIKAADNFELLSALANAENDIENADFYLSKFMKKKMLFLETIEGKQIPTSHILKTKDYGSIHSGELYLRESREFNRLRNEISKITNGFKTPVNIVITNKNNEKIIYENITSVQPSKQKNEKADFELLSNEGKVVCRISHKYGNKSKDFRQWSGITHFGEEKEVKKFAGLVLKEMSNATIYPKNFSMAMKISDKGLMRKAIFGFGKMEVDVVLQGRIYFKFIENRNEKSLFEMTSDVFQLSKFDDVSLLPEEYIPILFTMNSPGKCAFGIKNCRALIYPKHGKKIHKWLDSNDSVRVLPPPIFIS